MMTYIALISTYVVFGGLGYLLSRRFKKHLTVRTWVTLAIATIFSQWVLPNVRIIDIFDFKMFVNFSLQGFFLGILAGFSIRAIKAT
jgi:hypothetical protein